MSDVRYHRVSPKFWSDPTVLGWDDDTRLLALYLLTCEHRSTEGLFRLPKQYILADLEWSPERLAEPFARLVTDGFIDYDDDARVMLIVKALAYQAPSNPNGVKAALKVLSSLPPTRLYSAFYDLAGRHCERLCEALPEPLRQPLGDPPSPSPAQEPLVGTADAVTDEDDRFEQFWDAYPRHHETNLKGGGGNKKTTRRRFGKLKRADQDEVLAAVGPYASVCLPGGRFPKNAERFLTDEFWKTYLEMPNPADDDEFVGGVRRVR